MVVCYPAAERGMTSTTEHHAGQAGRAGNIPPGAPDASARIHQADHPKGHVRTDTSGRPPRTDTCGSQAGRIRRSRSRQEDNAMGHAPETDTPLSPRARAASLPRALGGPRGPRGPSGPSGPRGLGARGGTLPASRGAPPPRWASWLAGGRPADPARRRHRGPPRPGPAPARPPPPSPRRRPSPWPSWYGSSRTSTPSATNTSRCSCPRTRGSS